MMVVMDFSELRAGVSRYLPFSLLRAAVRLTELVFAVGAWNAGLIEPSIRAVPAGAMAGMTNTQALGSVLYTRYAYVFEAAGLVLLVAMIGAIVLTHRQRTGVRRQNIGDQIARRPEPTRSEEHTSELQSLMRTSYAVFCLKK